MVYLFRVLEQSVVWQAEVVDDEFYGSAVRALWRGFVDHDYVAGFPKVFREMGAYEARSAGHHSHEFISSEILKRRHDHGDCRMVSGNRIARVSRSSGDHEMPEKPSGQRVRCVKNTGHCGVFICRLDRQLRGRLQSIFYSGGAGRSDIRFSSDEERACATFWEERHNNKKRSIFHNNICS